MIDPERIRPLQDNVLVRLDMHSMRQEDEEVLSSGIILPKQRNIENTDALEATVIAAGPGHYPDPWMGLEEGTAPIGASLFIPMNAAIKKNARVLVRSQQCGDRVYDQEHEEYRMVREHNLVAVLE